jgi:hypothetical protein
MEEKKLLKLIKDDIAHLEGITGDFSLESPPSSDEVELALVRAKTLLRELELLHKVAAQHESVSVDLKFLNRLTTETPLQYQSDPEPFELFSRESINDDRESIILPEHQDHYSDEKTPDDKMNSEDGHYSENSDEDTTKENEDEKHFSALVEPTDSVDPAPESPVIVEDEEENVSQFAGSKESVILDDNLSESPNKEDEEVINAPMNEAVRVDENASESIPEHMVYKEETIIQQEVQDRESLHEVVTGIPLDNSDHTGDIVAEEFKEEKKTLNETLGESHQMVNDILAPEKEEIGFQIIQLNSIWDGIGINDRFLFIRELFANSSAKFENTINALDKLSTIQEAVNYLKMNFKWNKTEASHKFLILVKRRFIK